MFIFLASFRFSGYLITFLKFSFSFSGVAQLSVSPAKLKLDVAPTPFRPVDHLVAQQNDMGKKLKG
jgi:hypothetical protein